MDGRGIRHRVIVDCVTFRGNCREDCMDDREAAGLKLPHI